MKLFAIVILGLLPIFSFGQKSTQKDYSIFFPPEFPSETKDDIINLLNKATSGRWSPVSDKKLTTPGFILEYENNPGFKKKETFRLQSDGSKLLTISSSSPEGLTFGIYKYLR